MRCKQGYNYISHKVCTISISNHISYMSSDLYMKRVACYLIAVSIVIIVFYGIVVYCYTAYLLLVCISVY